MKNYAEEVKRNDVTVFMAPGEEDNEMFGDDIDTVAFDVTVYVAADINR